MGDYHSEQSEAANCFIYPAMPPVSSSIYALSKLRINLQILTNLLTYLICPGVINVFHKKSSMHIKIVKSKMQVNLPKAALIYLKCNHSKCISSELSGMEQRFLNNIFILSLNHEMKIRVKSLKNPRSQEERGLNIL